MLAQVDQQLYGDETAAVTRLDVLDAFSDYVADELKRGIALKHMTRHILGLFQGVPGARQFRRVISEQAHRPGAGLEVLAAARQAIVEGATAYPLDRKSTRLNSSHVAISSAVYCVNKQK